MERREVADCMHGVTLQHMYREIGVAEGDYYFIEIIQKNGAWKNTAGEKKQYGNGKMDSDTYIHTYVTGELPEVAT